MKSTIFKHDGSEQANLCMLELNRLCRRRMWFNGTKGNYYGFDENGTYDFFFSFLTIPSSFTILTPSEFLAKLKEKK